MKTIFLSVLVIGTAVILFSIYKSGQPVKSLFKSVIQGVLSLIAVNVTGMVTGVTLSLNWYTVSAVSVFGLPGTVALTVFKLFFR